VIDSLKQSDPDFSAEVYIARDSDDCYTGQKISSVRFFPAWYLGEKHSAVSRALGALHAIGLESKIDTYQFCTNGSASAGELDIPTFGFGPSRENQAHVTDEYIEIDQLLAAARGYIALARELTLDCKK
jgi:acetylornithine deacetylase/succinyl-diaminopimelate desuccinylase-like protein